MVLQYHMVATVQAAILEAQAGAFSVGEAREHGCETANDACAHTHPRVVENTLGSGGGGGGGGGLHRTAIGSVVVRELLSPIVVRVRDACTALVSTPEASVQTEQAGNQWLLTYWSCMMTVVVARWYGQRIK